MSAEYDGMAVHGVEPGLRVTDIVAALAFWRDLCGFEPYAEILAPGDVHVYGLRYGNAMVKLMYVDEAPGDGQRSDRYGAPAGGQARAAFASHYLTVHVRNALALQRECEAAGVRVLVPYSRFTPARQGDPECAF